MVTAEYAPIAKTGGLADMVTGLGRALVAAGHDVRVVLPRYGAIPLPGLAVGDLQVSPVAVDGAHPGYGFRQRPRAGNGDPLVYLVDCPALFGGPAIYGGGELEARRFALLCHAALRLPELLDWSPDIVHCHDWHAAPAAVLLRTGYRASRRLAAARTVLTLHNIGYQGVFPGTLATELGLPPAATPAADLNLLRDGIAVADALSTVSPTHAAEILTAEYGKGLDALLRSRSDRLTGILNGVDDDAWNPATDPALPARYDARSLAGKQACRTALAARAGFGAPADLPLLGMVTRLAEQKGIDLTLGALAPRLERGELRAVILGQGEDRYVAALRELAARWPDRFHYFDVQDEDLARLVFAGADAFLVPSLYEPCGLTQMYALRYGAVPVVRETGGLKDTVRHFDGLAGNGSVFKDADVNGLGWALGELLAWYRDPAAWRRVVANGMAADFSWRHQAPEYERLYARTLALPAG